MATSIRLCELTSHFFMLFHPQRLRGAFNKLPLIRAMHIQSIPMWVGSSNNYAYLVVDDKSKDAVIIDPANPPEYAAMVYRLITMC